VCSRPFASCWKPGRGLLLSVVIYQGRCPRKIFFTSFLLSLVPVFSAAYAGTTDTITLSSEHCVGGLSPICYAVPNNAGATIAYVDWASRFSRLFVSLNGTTYDSGLYAVSGLENVPLYAPDGAVIYASLSFHYVSKPCVREGRVTVCPVIATLTGGKLVR